MSVPQTNNSEHYNYELVVWCDVFFRLYIGNRNEIDENESKFFTKMNASIGKVELPDRPSMNDTTAGKLAQTQFISSTIKVR